MAATYLNNIWNLISKSTKTEHQKCKASTFEGTISTAGEGKLESRSETMDTPWLVLSWAIKPIKHWDISEGARILVLLSSISQNLKQKKKVE